MSTEIQLHKQSELKLRNLGLDKLQSLSEDFIKLSGLMGFKKELSPGDAVEIAEFVKIEFKDFTIQEIQKSFRMAISGILVNKDGEKVEPYGSLNINYVGTVLSLYRKHRTIELRRVNKAVPFKKKGFCEMVIEEKKLMNAIFRGVNKDFMDRGLKIKRFYSEGMSSVLTMKFNNPPKLRSIEVTYSSGIKFFDCLKYFGLIPIYSKEVSKKLWEEAKERQIKRLDLSFDRESRLLSSLIKDHNLTVPENVRSKAKISITNNYKGLIAIRCLGEYREGFNSLYQAREDLGFIGKQLRKT